jgi:hypothetical protein
MKIKTKSRILKSKTWKLTLPKGTLLMESFSTDKKGNPIRGTEMPVAYILP